MKIPVITGPTCVGKTAISEKLVERCDGEIITADRYQMFRGMDIGSAKPLPDDRSRYHLLNSLSPDQVLTRGEYLEVVKKLIPQIQRRGRVPMVEGCNIGLVGALSDKSSKICKPGDEFKFYGFIRNLDEIQVRVRFQLNNMIEHGLIVEVETLLAAGYGNSNALKMAICYKEVIAYLNGEITYSQMVECIMHNTMRAVRDQLRFVYSKSNMEVINLSESKMEDVVNYILDDLDFSQQLLRTA